MAQKVVWPLMGEAVSPDDRRALAEFITSQARLTNGAKVREFEEAWTAWQGVPNSLMVNSGSSANLLLLAALRELLLGPNPKAKPKILLQACTWSTTVSSVIQAGFTPVFADISLSDYGFCPLSLERVLGEHPDVFGVVLTHLLGVPADMRRVRALLPRAHLIEDCCESHGATRGPLSEKVGTAGWGSSFSFFFGHHMTTVEGGIVCTADEEIHNLMRMKRSHGLAREAKPDKFLQYSKENPSIDPKFLFMTHGYNMRATEIQAVLGLRQLAELDGYILERQKNDRLWRSIMARHGDLFVLPHGEGSSSMVFPFVCRDHKTKQPLEQRLNEIGIETRPILGGNLAHHPFVQDGLKEGHIFVDKETPNADLLHANGFYIGNSQFITADHLDALAESMAEVLC